MRGRLLFRKEHSYETRGIDTEVHSCDEWGIMPTSASMQVASEVKELPSNDWKDENGDDEYIPDEVVFKAYQQEISFAYKGEDPSGDIRRFIEYLAYGGAFSMYDERTKTGRQKVRFVKYDTDAEYIPEDGTSTVLFAITLKVNDPITEVELNV